MIERGRRRRVIGWGLFLFVLVGAATAWFVLDPGFRTGKETLPVAENMPADEFDQRVRDYILNNPEVIVAAVRQLQARQQTSQVNEVQATLKARADEVFRDPDSPVGGNPDGDVTLVEFFDYNCPYCRRVVPVMNEAEAEDADLRIVYKEFPILGPNSLFAAKAALAAHRQGRYLAFHKALMEANAVADQSRVLEVAAEVGLDIDRLRVDMEDPAIRAVIDRNFELARALRINGTPGFVVGEQILRGATDVNTLQSLIRTARDKG